jgi:hypothetical protein
MLASLSPLSRPLQQRPQRPPPPQTTPRHVRMTNDDTTTTTWSRGISEKQGAQTTCRLGPGMFFFSLFLFFTNMYIYIYASTGPRTHPRNKSESVGRVYASSGPRTHPRNKSESVSRVYASSGPRTHPRCKRESVGRFGMTTHPQTPPSCQTRVGGVLFCTLRTHPR